MKYNLKNRPRYEKVKNVGSPDWYTHHKDEEWFDGFEKELKEMPKQAEEEWQLTENGDSFESPEAIAKKQDGKIRVYINIKQILGDSE